jgi:molybdopterin converting factor small subunit
MAKITAKVVGGKLRELEDMETVREVRNELGLDKTYTATVNGEPEDDQYELSDFDYIAFAPAVKGGRR